MRTVRKWGHGPYTVAVIHGGPGAPGEMAPVARELSAFTGVIEPFQTEMTLDGQVQELRQDLEQDAQVPAVLVGFSWGAFLSWLTAARYPHLVRKLILVSSAPFEESYAAAITRTRLDRMNAAERAETKSLMAQIDDPDVSDKDTILARLSLLLARADACDPISYVDETFHTRSGIFRGVWDQAGELRKKGVLLQMAHAIRCPVVAIHGDYDPHPAKGVEEPLSRACPDFRFCLLEKCGHRPWIEREASDAFYEILIREIKE
ncbi:MAG: Alpha/beta hydrolase family protein [Methanoregula sp. PtaU1.Bin006]|uniref:alpha/beta fold hydrolase n=1 Tax=Methanoregula sp. PtaU1.Bin006 TaxID=1811681 RepID=UPI0009CAAF92|nr:alpha/beta hydrolase [Methanoregula sp. PtaU1.Bin006]OPY35171.1 MAG: Alpha/beta hydrolase family protein [Methanoregula sp. PtaU1.Bin006]